ncbi:unnamed protein product [Sphagnum balticum]
MVIMTSLDHVNIGRLYEVYDYKSYYVLILELCEGGELFKKILATKEFSEEYIAKIIKQILKALMYLRHKGVVHRDLKPENMLFDKDSHLLKIIDFGIAVEKKPGEMLSERVGTPYYVAPEVDENGDGVISKEEFVKLLMRDSKKRWKKMGSRGKIASKSRIASRRNLKDSGCLCKPGGKG